MGIPSWEQQEWSSGSQVVMVTEGFWIPTLKKGP